MRGDQTCKFVDGVAVCVDCGVPTYRGSESSRPACRCRNCRNLRAFMMEKLGGQHYAQRQTHRRVRHGEIPHPTALTCVDCGKGAQVYEHRDYAFPDAVEPVCRSCNQKRGHAVYAWEIPAELQVPA